MKYIVYLTKNLKSCINGNYRIYIGVHKTEDPSIFDGYLGDGCYINQASSFMYPKTAFQCAVKKYGTKSFERTTLFIYDNIEDAYRKKLEIVDKDFCNQSYTYNAASNILNKPIYQFDLNGKLLKKWEYSEDLTDFFNTPIDKFKHAIAGKYVLLGSFWNYTRHISNYDPKARPSSNVTHIYNKDGKWLKEFRTKEECAKYIGCTEQEIAKAILIQNMINGYYISNSITDQFKPKPRRRYCRSKIYVYNENSELLGVGIGKEIMPIIKQNSWRVIANSFELRNGWYNNYYLSETPVEKVPEKYTSKKLKIDVYTKFGDYIETINTIKELKEKYNIPNVKIKHLEQGNKYFEGYIFKYHSK